MLAAPPSDDDAAAHTLAAVAAACADSGVQLWTEVDLARLEFSGLGTESYHESCVIADWSSAAEVQRCERDAWKFV